MYSIDKFTMFCCTSYRRESTFMREMCDISAILKNATVKSLVLIDELGKSKYFYC